MCSICLEKFNITNRLKVPCPFCEFSACKTCTQTYLLSVTQDPHCMNCKHVWNRAFIDSFCTKVFRNREWKLHRENVLLEIEKARMPETQPYVTQKLALNSLKISYDWLVYLLNAVKTSDLPIHVKTCLSDELRIAIVNSIEQIHEYIYGDVPMDTPVIIQKCPSGECRGFLLDNYTCGVCKVFFCEKCHEVHEHGHVCNEDTVKTIKLLKRDTKPCPSCNTPIYKLEGCAQMWCTQCHTAFDWRTGYIDTGRIHNPHYFEFKKRTREHGDIPCGGRPTHTELENVGASMFIRDVNTKLTIMDIELGYKYGYINRDNLYLRIDYMMNKISEEEFKIQIQRIDKRNAKMLDIQDIYRMFIDTVGDILRQYILDTSKESMYIRDITELIDYTNGVIENIRARYNSRVPHNIIL